MALWCATCNGETALRSGLCEACCRNVRVCEQCGDVNASQTAEGCRLCSAGRLALWCANCHNEADLLSGLCALCHSKRCMYCAGRCGGDWDAHRCGSCGAALDLCVDCCPLLPREYKPVCIEHWEGISRQCIGSASQDVRNNTDKFRRCRECHAAWFCKNCNKAQLRADAAMCQVCLKVPALWCGSCCSTEALASGRCDVCFRKMVNGGEYCDVTVSESSLACRRCSVDGCLRLVLSCEQCVASVKDRGLVCIPCWGDLREKRCIVCNLRFL